MIFRRYVKMGKFRIEMEGANIIIAFLTGIHVKKDIDAIIVHLKEKIQKSRDFNILLNIGGIEEISGGARRALAEWISKEPCLFHKLAITGEKAKTKIMASFIITATGRGEYVKYFNNEEEALSWLRK
jgi:hypothetical protein